MKSSKSRASSRGGDGVVLIKYEPKLNQSWEDPLPHRSPPTVVNFTGTPIARRSDVAAILANHRKNNNFAAQKQQGTVNLGNTRGGGGGAERKKLEHTPSARTVSSEDSWCSEGVASDRELSSDDEDDSQLSDRSISSTTPRNSQLRLTLNKARQHLSFDKWRNSNNNNNSPSVNNSLNSSSGGSSTSSTPSQIIMPSANSESPSSEPFSRLSRWFSIRRGSTHQYDVDKGRSDSRAGSVEPDTTDSSNRASIIATGNAKMPQLSEMEEESQAFALGLLNGASKPNGTSSPLTPTTDGGGGPKIPARPIAPSLPPAPAGLSQQDLKRRHIVAAIVHSENSYVATLQRLVNDYKKPLEESNPPILSSTKISTLFHRLPEILQCHNMFRIALADCVRNWDRDEKLGDVFFAAFGKTIVLDVYSGFINNFSVAMDLAKMEAKRKSALADFFKVKQISAHDRLSFFGLMVKPVQRFPQFILFLQDLLKHTPQGHHDRMSLQLALTQLESLAEMLNERKREAEQNQAFREMLGHISGTFNVRALASSNDSTRNRYLLREDNVTLLEFNTSGFIVKSKQRRLLLLNDRIICVSVAPKQSADFGATEKLSFKWMYPVTDVEIVDNATSATLSRILTAGMNKGGSLKSNSSFGESPVGGASANGADNLCTEMSNLMHDYEVMSRINDLVGSLKGSYKDLNLEVTRRLLSTIQTSIQKKDEEMAWVDSCCMQIVVKNKSGKEETFTFQTENPTVKKEWVTELRLAQLALDTNNSPAWKIPENEHIPLTKMPLFVRSQPVYKSQQQTEVRCGCYYSTLSNNARLSTKRRNKFQNYLWLCSTDGSSSHIALFSQHHQQAGVLKDIASFDLVEVTVTAMEYVKGMPAQTLYDSSPDLSTLDCIWIAADNKKILLYLANNPNVPEQVAHCSIPAVANQILYHMENVFVALISGTVLIYRKNTDLLWHLKDFQSVPLSSQELITSLMPINGNVYAACGKKVWVINGYSGDVGRSFDVQIGASSNTVNLMAHSGIGLWISLKNSSVICLYHTETFKHLQDINIAVNVLKVTSSQRITDNNNSSVFVTALMACKGLLWVGTNVGIALTIPLPRLEGVPIISGSVNISYHAHYGPITFFLPLLARSYNFPAPPSSKETTPETPAIAETAQKPAEEEKETSPRRFEIDAKKLPVSPVVRRRKINAQDLARMSKTLPRGLGSAAFFNPMNSPTNSVHQSDHTCDVYGLYGDLIFVKEDYDAEEGQQLLMDGANYETLHRSDPELAAIPAKMSTLDRRLRMKVSRPRSLDLSNWSVDSRSSSLYTSSGSEESMGIKMFGAGSSSVSRNSSNASGHKFNGSELTNISEHKADETPSSTEPAAPVPEPPPPPPPATASTMKRKKNKPTHQAVEIQGRRTILTLMGGRGYINWRHVWGNQVDGTPKGHSRSNSICVMPKLPNHNDAHVIIWEKKL